MDWIFDSFLPSSKPAMLHISDPSVVMSASDHSWERVSDFKNPCDSAHLGNPG